MSIFATRTTVVTVAFGLLMFAGGFALGTLALPRHGLHGRYYPNLTRSGPPLVETLDSGVSTDTIGQGTARTWSAFSAEWSGFVVLDRSGVHTFATVSDDGSELEVADVVVVRNGGVHGPREVSGSIRLASGIYPIRLRYEQAGGGFALTLLHGVGGSALAPLPREMLLPEAMPLLAFRLRSSAPLILGLIAVAAWAGLARRWTAADAPPNEGLTRTTLDDTRVAIAILLVWGVLMRIVMMLGSTGILWPDSEVFVVTVDSIFAGRYLEHDPFRTLVYPYYLAAMFAVFGWTKLAGVLIVAGQHAMGVAASVFFYLVGRRGLGPRAAIAGALLMNIHTIQLFYEASILSEALFVFVLSVALWIVVRFMSRPSAAGAVAIGLACAAVTFVRPVGQWWIAIVVPFAWLAGTTTRQRVIAVGAIAGVYLTLLLPWTLVNQRQYGFTGVALGRGLGLFIRAFEVDRLEAATPTNFPEVRALFDYARARGLGPTNFVRDTLNRERRYSSAQTDELMYRFAMETVARQPVAFAANSARQWLIQLGGNLGGVRVCASSRGAYLCSGRTQGHSMEPFPNEPLRDREVVRWYVVSFFRHAYIRMGAILALALFGMVWFFSGRRPKAVAGLLAFTIAYFTLVPAMTQWPQDRYRLPVDPLLFMFAATGVAGVFAIVRDSITLRGRPAIRH